MQKHMQPLRVLCYADMDTLIPYCVAAAEMLRAELGAHIVMMVVDRNLHCDPAFANYELHDHQSVFAKSNGFVPVKPAQAECAGEAAKPVAMGPTPADTNTPDADGGPAAAKPGDGDVSNESRTSAAPQVAGARHRIDLFGLRKVLARSRTLRIIYSSLRNPASILIRARYLVLRIPIFAVIAYPAWAWHRGRRVRAFLRAIRPDVIILAEDNIERLSTTLVNEGRRQGIASIVLPFTIPNPLEPAKSYRHRMLNQVRGPLSWLVSILYPKWCYRLGDQKLLRVPAFTALVMDALGQSSPDPWTLNRGEASRIALDSEAQRDRYIRLGFPAGQLAVVG